RFQSAFPVWSRWPDVRFSIRFSIQRGEHPEIGGLEARRYPDLAPKPSLACRAGRGGCKSNGGTPALSLARARNIADLRALARARLPRMVFDYIDGGADDERTLAANESRLKALTLSWD